MGNNLVLEKLKDNEERITPTRKVLAKILTDSQNPINVSDILVELRKEGFETDKTTVYRNLELLMRLNLVKEVEFGDESKYYEIDTSHHHHLICKNCKKIIGVSCPEVEEGMNAMFERVKNKMGFYVKEHMLEFYGTCSACA